MLDPAEEGTQRGIAAQAGVHVRRLERGERGDTVLAQFNRYLAWGGTKPHSVATEKAPGKCLSSSSLPEGLTPIITRPQKLFQLDATYGLGRVKDDVRH